jgi:hypothetical protein
MTSTTIEAPQGHSRRSIVAGLLAMLPAAKTASAATPAPANPDAELIALAEQIAELKTRSDAADAERDCRFEIYKSMVPQQPRKLVWKIGDVVGYSREIHHQDGKMYLWCDLNEVERLRHGELSFEQWIFIGTEDERKKLGLQNWHDNRIKPAVGYDHLFVSNNHEWRRKRAQELIAALDEYNAAEEATDIASGWSAADEACYEIQEQMSELVDRALDLKPSTVEGYEALEAVRAAA